ncbi:MAG: symmetrical bis(5'-nucleosyl)-tetraphosphatase [Acidobacteriota bacterium]|nr:symmetrical bis(5'-nucleosyl)-tetraphosphatase [Acidobacteriota bacterium]
MATYALGDVHGCYKTLRKLLRRIGFDPDHDRLWLVGDLVNRGPDSLAVLRWARDLHRQMGERLRVVQGNHDLHLQALAAGLARLRSKDMLKPVLEAKDGDRLVEWLAEQPLLHREGNWLMVHAGLLPHWTPEDAESEARRVQAALLGGSRRQLLQRPASKPAGAEAELQRSLTAFTRLRCCTADGEPTPHKGPPEEAPAGELAWFDVPGRRSSDATAIFGHWAALGLRVQPGILALDSGAAWGGKLTAVRLEDGKIFQQRAKETAHLRPDG